MELISEFICFLAICFNMYAFIKCYELTTKSKVKISFINIVIFLLASMAFLLSNYYLELLLKIFFALIILTVTYKLIFNEQISVIIFKTCIIYLILTICDLWVSVIFLFFPVKSFLDIGRTNIIRALNTLLVSLFLLLVFLFNKIVYSIRKLSSYISENHSSIAYFIMAFSFVVFMVLAIFSATSFNIEIFLISALLVIFFLILCVVMIAQYFKNKTKEEEQKALLELMREYETILDNERINRHEMLNNLIVIKSFEDKSTVEFEETLNQIISNYQGKNAELYSNLYKLPSGLKGIIYYKMSKIKENNIDFHLLISKDVEENFNKLEQKIYYKVCKIIGIFLDNSVEAATVTKDKILLIDIYYEEDYLMIYIENSFSNNIDLNSIYNKGVSSKGDNRGYGLYIVRKLLEDTDGIEYSQYIENNKFVSILKIKNPRSL